MSPVGTIRPIKQKRKITMSNKSIHSQNSQSRRTVASHGGVIGLGHDSSSKPRTETLSQASNEKQLRKPKRNAKSTQAVKDVATSQDSDVTSSFHGINNLELATPECDSDPLAESPPIDLSQQLSESEDVFDGEVISDSGRPSKRQKINHWSPEEDAMRDGDSQLMTTSLVLQAWGLKDTENARLSSMDKLILKFLGGKETAEDAKQFLKNILDRSVSNFGPVIDALVAAVACGILPALELLTYYTRIKCQENDCSMHEIVLCSILGKTRNLIPKWIFDQSIVIPGILLRDLDLTPDLFNPKDKNRSSDSEKQVLPSAVERLLKNAVIKEAFNKSTEKEKLRFEMTTTGGNKESTVLLHWTEIIDFWWNRLIQNKKASLWDAALNCGLQNSIFADQALTYYTTSDGKDPKNVHFHSVCIPEDIRGRLSKTLAGITSTNDINMFFEMIYSSSGSYKFKEKLSISFWTFLLKLGLSENDISLFLEKYYPVAEIRKNEPFPLYVFFVIKLRNEAEIVKLVQDFDIYFPDGLPRSIVLELSSKDFLYFFDNRKYNITIEKMWNEGVKWATRMEIENIDELIASDQARLRMNDISSLYKNLKIMELLPHKVIQQGFDYYNLLNN